MNDAAKKSRFDLSQLSQADWHNISATFHEALLRFYDDPVNRKKFEEWQRQRQARNAASSS